MDGREYIETTLNFAAPHLRGFRAPGGYTSQHDRPPKGAGGGPTTMFPRSRTLPTVLIPIAKGVEI